MCSSVKSAIIRVPEEKMCKPLIVRFMPHFKQLNEIKWPLYYSAKCAKETDEEKMATDEWLETVKDTLAYAFSRVCSPLNSTLSTNELATFFDNQKGTFLADDCQSENLTQTRSALFTNLTMEMKTAAQEIMTGYGDFLTSYHHDHSTYYKDHLFQDMLETETFWRMPNGANKEAVTKMFQSVMEVNLRACDIDNLQMAFDVCAPLIAPEDIGEKYELLNVGHFSYKGTGFLHAQLPNVIFNGTNLIAVHECGKAGQFAEACKSLEDVNCSLVSLDGCPLTWIPVPSNGLIVRRFETDHVVAVRETYSASQVCKAKTIEYYYEEDYEDFNPHGSSSSSIQLVFPRRQSALVKLSKFCQLIIDDNVLQGAGKINNITHFSNTEYIEHDEPVMSALVKMFGEQTFHLELKDDGKSLKAVPNEWHYFIWMHFISLSQNPGIAITGAMLTLLAAALLCIILFVVFKCSQRRSSNNYYCL